MGAVLSIIRGVSELGEAELMDFTIFQRKSWTLTFLEKKLGLCHFSEKKLDSDKISHKSWT